MDDEVLVGLVGQQIAATMRALVTGASVKSADAKELLDAVCQGVATILSTEKSILTDHEHIYMESFLRVFVSVVSTTLTFARSIDLLKDFVAIIPRDQNLGHTLIEHLEKNYQMQLSNLNLRDSMTLVSNLCQEARCPTEQGE